MIADELTRLRLSDAFGPRSRASHQARLRGLDRATASIAIALSLLTALYFVWQFTR